MDSFLTLKDIEDTNEYQIRADIKTDDGKEVGRRSIYKGNFLDHLNSTKTAHRKITGIKKDLSKRHSGAQSPSKRRKEVPDGKTYCFSMTDSGVAMIGINFGSTPRSPVPKTDFSSLRNHRRTGWAITCRSISTMHAPPSPPLYDMDDAIRSPSCQRRVMGSTVFRARPHQ